MVSDSEETLSERMLNRVPSEDLHHLQNLSLNSEVKIEHPSPDTTQFFPAGINLRSMSPHDQSNGSNTSNESSYEWKPDLEHAHDDDRLGSHRASPINCHPNIFQGSHGTESDLQESFTLYLDGVQDHISFDCQNLLTSVYQISSDLTPLPPGVPSQHGCGRSGPSEFSQLSDRFSPTLLWNQELTWSGQWAAPHAEQQREVIQHSWNLDPPSQYVPSYCRYPGQELTQPWRTLPSSQTAASSTAYSLPQTTVEEQNGWPAACNAEDHPLIMAAMAEPEWQQDTAEPHGESNTQGIPLMNSRRASSEISGEDLQLLFNEIAESQEFELPESDLLDMDHLLGDEAYPTPHWLQQDYVQDSRDTQKNESAASAAIAESDLPEQALISVAYKEDDLAAIGEGSLVGSVQVELLGAKEERMTSGMDLEFLRDLDYGDNWELDPFDDFIHPNLLLLPAEDEAGKRDRSGSIDAANKYAASVRKKKQKEQRDCFGRLRGSSVTLDPVFLHSMVTIMSAVDVSIEEYVQFSLQKGRNSHEEAGVEDMIRQEVQMRLGSSETSDAAMDVLQAVFRSITDAQSDQIVEIDSHLRPVTRRILQLKKTFVSTVDRELTKPFEKIIVKFQMKHRLFLQSKRICFDHQHCHSKCLILHELESACRGLTSHAFHSSLDALLLNVSPLRGTNLVHGIPAAGHGREKQADNSAHPGLNGSSRKGRKQPPLAAVKGQVAIYEKYPRGETVAGVSGITRKEKGLSGARGELPQAAAAHMKAWLIDHWDDPYPTRHDKLQLSRDCRINVKQVEDWMVNARARLWKPLTLQIVKEMQNDN